MKNLELTDGGYAVKVFEVETDDKAMLHVVAATPTDEVTLIYHRSVDGQTFTAHPETLTFTGFVHEPLYGLKRGEWMKITSNKVLSKAEIMW